jgi:hypothetical protein
MAVLDKIIKGRQPRPLFMLVHGPPGVGKTSFAAAAPEPLFFDCENRTNHLDLARVRIDSWEMLIGALVELVTVNPKPCQTLVIDTVDAVEQLIWKSICDREKTTMERACGGYGKAYNVARDEFMKLLMAAEKLRTLGINVVLLAHSDLKPFRNPVGEDYDQWSIRLHKAARAVITDRVDLVGFATFEDYARKKDDKSKVEKAKAFTTGDRVLKFDHHPAYETKAGVPVADQVALNWAEFTKALTP